MTRRSNSFHPRDWRIAWYALAGTAFAQAVFAAGFIWRSSVVVEGHRYFCLFDDAMISMRYAANWAGGAGLTWNPGERVEGYTNFGWTAVMALCHLTGMSKSHTCLTVQLLGVPVLWMCLLATMAVARACRLLPIVAAGAIVIAGMFYNLLFFTLLGMETGLLTALVTFGLAGAAMSIRQRDVSWSAMLWFIPAVLVRMDAALLCAVAFVGVFLTVRQGRRRLLAGGFLVAATMLAHAMWRYNYYGQWLPNTYYLKATNWELADRLLPGIKHTVWTAVQLVVPCLLAVPALLRFRPELFLLFGAFVTTVGYQFYLGGDAWPLSRWVLPTVPGLCVLASLGLHDAMGAFFHSRTGAAAILVRTFGIGFVMLGVNLIELDHFTLLERPQSHEYNLQNIRLAKVIEAVIPPDKTVAVSLAGTFPYYSERRCFDFLGKCDPHIARMKALPRVHRSGHNKYDTEYTLATYRPDLILHYLDTSHPVFLQDYAPVVFPVDGKEVPFCIRRDLLPVHGARPLGWQALYAWMRANPMHE